MENNELKVSRIPKPFSIESLISKQSELSPPSPPSSNCSNKPSPPPMLESHLLGFNPANYHPAMLPFPLYSPWIAGYLSQQQHQSQHQQSERLSQFMSENNLPPNVVLDHTNYLLAHHKDRITQFFNNTNNGASHNNNKLSELFSDFSSNERAKIFLPNNTYRTEDPPGCKDKSNNLDIESMDSCSSDISMTSSPDGSSVKHPGTFHS